MVAPGSVGELAAHIRAGGLVLDVREPAAYADTHVRGSLNVALSSRSAPYWLSTLVPSGAALVAITAFDREVSYVAELAEIAEREVRSALPLDRDAFAAHGIALASIRLQTPDELADDSRRTVIDVREVGEWADGHVPGALWIPLEELERRAAEVPDGPVALICTSGFRSSIGASLLERAGRSDLANVWGGTTAWEQLGLPLRTGRAS